MKRILLLVICVNFFYSSLAQNITSDTTLAGQSYRKARKLLDNRRFEKIDSVLILSKQATGLYAKNHLWARQLNSLCNQIEVYCRKSNELETKALFDSIQRLSCKQFGERNIYLANAYHYLGYVYFLTGKYDKVLENYNKSLDIRKELLGGENIMVAQSYNNIGLYYQQLTEYDKALDYLVRALKIRLKNLGEKHILIAMNYNNIAILYQAKGDYDKALENYIKGSDTYRAVYGDKNIEMAVSYENIGSVYYNLSEFDKALEYYQKNLALRRELLGEKNFDVAEACDHVGNVYYYKSEFDKALKYYLESMAILKELFGEKHLYVANSYNIIGNVYYARAEFDKALDYFLTGLSISREKLGEKHTLVASLYNNLGMVYYAKAEYEKALDYFIKSSDIYKELLGGKDPHVGNSYNNIGVIYTAFAEYDKALDYYLRSLSIQKELLGEKNLDVATAYNNIGLIYRYKEEYDKALDYYFKSLTIYQQLLGEKQTSVANSYYNIGNVYSLKKEHDKAMEYYLKSMEINKELVGEKHQDVARSLMGIGGEYYSKGEFDKALEYYFRGLEIYIALFGEKHTDVAISYNNIGTAYYSRFSYTKALEYYLKGLTIYRELLGEKHIIVANSYNNLGQLYLAKKDYPRALNYYQKSIASSLRNFNDTNNVYSVPVMKDFLNWDYLLEALNKKAMIISNSAEMAENRSQNKFLLEIALKHYLAADTLISAVRKSITTQSDKISLGENASGLYAGAIQACGKLAAVCKKQEEKQKYFGLSFYFSEQNKNMVLLEALAGTEGLKFAGIPDSLTRKEHTLKVNIAFYEKKLAEGTDSITGISFRNKLFAANRQYEELISTFEKDYSGYFNLKYAVRNPSIKDIQDILDTRTAIRSYFIGDSSVFIYSLTKRSLNVYQVPLIKNMADSITWFRYGLTKTSQRMQEYYRRLGFKLYQQTFPAGTEPDKQIKNLIIIPDGPLSIIPFESLLTENYTGAIDAYREYPYLVKKFNVSYSYSANLFHLTFSRKAQTGIEITKLNDWLAFAPIFDKSGDQNLSMSSRKLKNQLTSITNDSLMSRRSIFNRDFITPLPATEAETETILNLYDNNNLKAKVLFHNDANEEFIKSGKLEQYRAIHFATHGFVNSEKPELSGLILAQDTTGGEDGVLYSGEIYNLKLNADLVVLSACETGLGKIQKGEGIIGLTRALLYAGAKNIVVSLWEVADKSTSDLMVDFYRNSLGSKGQLSYSGSLRNAKLKMISEGGVFAHPLYWSPFILIGR